METNFISNKDYDMCLLPFSPLSENDTLEIKVRGFNNGADGNINVEFKIDNTLVSVQTLYIAHNSYGYASCRIPMKGKSGKHTAEVNGITGCFEVLENPEPKLDGGFIIIGPPNDRIPTDTFRKDLKSFTDSDWNRYIDFLAKTECKCIIFHNCQEYLIYNNFNPDPKNLTAHYDSVLYPKSDIKAKDPISNILQKGEEHGIHVFLSVGNCYGHTASDDDFYEMYDLYGKYKSFYGWYLSNEVDMGTFDLKAWETLKHQTSVARKISPVKPVLISPHGMPDSETVEYIKTNDVFDIMMPQDCVGQERLTISQSYDMHKKLKEVCNSTKKHLWANCEAFNFDNGLLVPRFKNGGMSGNAGFIQQIHAVRPHVEKIMNFAYTGFFTPPGFNPKVGGNAAVKQFEDYMYYLKSNFPKERR